jgi:hypothetical protein
MEGGVSDTPALVLVLMLAFEGTVDASDTAS